MNARKNERRRRALNRLTTQLKSKKKTNKEGALVEMTEKDIERAKKEVTVLEKRTYND